MRYDAIALTLLLIATFGTGVAPSVAMADAAATTIRHEPVRMALPGQSIGIRAAIAGTPPRSVSLFFTPSRDVAPFRLPMRASGEGVYAVTIPELNLAGLREVYYYIEARDANDGITETPWYTITIHTPADTADAAAAPVKPVAASSDGGNRWVKPTLIGAGVLAAGGITYAIIDGNSGGGGGGGDNEPVPPSVSGTYSGTSTTCTQLPSGDTSCENRGFTLTISDTGDVSSNDLRQGETMRGKMSGNSFILVAPVNQDGYTGEIQYLGTVVDQRVVGSIQGSASGDAGVVTFSGSFSGIKR